MERRTVTERCLTPRQLYLSTDLSIYRSMSSLLLNVAVCLQLEALRS